MLGKEHYNIYKCSCARCKKLILIREASSCTEFNRSLSKSASICMTKLSLNPGLMEQRHISLKGFVSAVGSQDLARIYWFTHSVSEFMSFFFLSKGRPN